MDILMNQTTRNGLSFSGVEDYSAVEVEEDRNEWGDIANSNLVLGLYGVICVLGITGNLLVAFVLLRVPSLRSNTSDFMVHLSLADFIVCVMVIPFKLVQTTGKYPPNPGFFGELRCRLYAGQFLFWVGTVVSVYSLVTVNLERFVAIVYPLKYKVVFTRRVKYYMIASCWIVGALSKVFLFLLYGEDEVVGCHFLGWPSSAVQAVVGLANFMVALFGPFVLMVLVQWKVISTLKRQVKMLKSQLSHNPADQRKMWQLRASQTLIRTLLIFVITFAVCWAPVQSMFLGYNFGGHLDFSSPAYHFGIILAVCNSCINPICYILTNQPFRKGIREAFRRGSNMARVEDSNTVSVSLRTEPK
ncbi:neuropeptide Y receptor type 1-like [Asterias amurensis]|uniref:neuropeptide Y receptor type 1-like n=1 Tax=Asterias amurensis TaxID=7602 RepID=UPI003AB1E816